MTRLCFRCAKNPVPSGVATCDPCMDEIYHQRPWADPRIYLAMHSTSPTDDEVERVARALSDSAKASWDNDKVRDDWHALARAALQAMGADEGLRSALEEAKLQLTYLDERFPTGTTPATIAKIDEALSNHQGNAR